jgi:hypothetical protein
MKMVSIVVIVVYFLGYSHTHLSSPVTVFLKKFLSAAAHLSKSEAKDGWCSFIFADNSHGTTFIDTRPILKASVKLPGVIPEKFIVPQLLS